MRIWRFVVFFGMVVVPSGGFSGLRMLAATPSFTITASNTTMPPSGFGTLPFTLTSVNGYTGSIYVTCSPTNPPAGAKLPLCGSSTTPHVSMLTANGTVEGSVTLIPYGDTVPLPVQWKHRGSGGSGSRLALTAVLMAGLGLRRRRWRGLNLVLVCALACFSGLSGCGGGNGGTKGTFEYTVTATDINTTVSATTTAEVTLP